MKRYLSSIVTKRWKSGFELPLGRIIVAQVVFAACGASALGQNWIDFVEESCRIVASPEVGLDDIQEKDIAFADLDGDGNTDMVIVRKTPIYAGGGLLNDN